MCLIALAYRVHPRFPLIVAANRDEFRDRPTAPAHFWSDAPHILAGRDLRAGGTWMGITRLGRFAAITNHRDLRRPPVQGPSRGALVRTALDGAIEPGPSPAYEGFNLLSGPLDALRSRNNIEPVDLALPPGVHGLSNDLLNTPWPKVERARSRLRGVIGGPGNVQVDGLFQLLADDEPAPDDQLPDTGLTKDLERAVSSIFIDSPGYGTRCSTVLLVDADGGVRFEERTAGGGTVIEEFRINE